MHKFRATYFGAFIFGWLLAFGTHVAWGYYPPLQATAGYGTHAVEYTVYNPEKQQGYVAAHYYPPTITVVNLQQHNGVIAWVVQDGTSYYVDCVTFDPALNTFQNDWWGPLPWVSLFQVLDGVVAFNIVDASGNVGARYATYDPAKGAWQKGVFIAGPGDVSTGLYCKDGVVVYRSFTNVGTYFADSIQMKLYDAKYVSGQWSNDCGMSHINGVFETVSISNATVYTTHTGYVSETIFGYEGGVYHPDKTTVPVAHFVAQPKVGSSSRWVWFTDMSLAGAHWRRLSQ